MSNNHENVPLAIQSDNRQTTLPFSPDVNGQVTSSQNGVAENHSNIKHIFESYGICYFITISHVKIYIFINNHFFYVMGGLFAASNTSN
jgi:hypothetical protein